MSEVKERVRVLKETTGSAAEKVHDLNFICLIIWALKIGDSISAATKPVRVVGEKLKEYVPDITETELAKRVSKSVIEAESKILENTNIYQYGGFKSKNDREKLKKNLESAEETKKANQMDVE